MKFINDRILKDMCIILFNNFGKASLPERIKGIEARLEKLETRNGGAKSTEGRKVGRPRKDAEV